ncbi:hypothetical protein [Aquirufa ecclesiirivi]|uniref:hypothetical protein n=1 Tax=Aquirufa ecclesiirivi TaxID=2715124 RepID=UPI0023D86411|nr:hypothetical protein [Aquirufa ecclesiirivi]MDF0692454.1 hypothetical protein [Aquirufa ecclesiirivi]
MKFIKSQNGSGVSVLKEILEKSFLQGQGDCSTQSAGLGVYLKNRGEDYSIIHFLPLNGLFEGNGHTIVLLQSKNTSILIDPIGKSAPILHGKFLNLNMLNKFSRNEFNQISFYKFNDFGTNIRQYYGDKFPSEIGVVPSSENDKFYKVSALLVQICPFEETIFTKKVYKGIAALFFSLPKIYVDNSGFKNLEKTYPHLYFLIVISHIYVINFWAILLLIVLFPIFNRISKNRNPNFYKNN